MTKKLHILIVEDSASDAALAARHIEHAGYDVRWERVETAAELKAALESEKWNVILCDHSMPDFSGTDALALVRASGRDIPFIFVSGTLGEDVAVEAMKAGAHDYVVKGHLKRLVPAIERELRDTEERRKRRQAEAALRASDTRFRALVENAMDIFTVIAPDTKMLLMSASVSRVLGYRPEELLGQQALVFIHPEDAPRVAKIARDALREPNSIFRVEFRFRHQDGSFRTLESCASNQFQNPAIGGIVVNSRDITERKRTEQDRVRLVTAMEQASDVVIITDREGGIQYVNPAFEQVTGYSKQEALGQNPRLLKSGKQDRAFYEQMWRALVRGEVWRRRFTNKRKDGTLYEEEKTIFPVRDPQHGIVSYVAVGRDVTREIQLEAQFRQAQKMESIGRLAGGVAHDFNNLLMAIMGYSDLTLKALPANEPARKHLEQVQVAGRRAAGLTRQLLAFSRKQVLQPKVLDLNALAANLSKMLRQLIGEDIHLTTTFDPALGRVQADSGQIEQIIINLAVNARDAMPEGGGLTLQTANAELDTAYASQHEEVTPGRYVLLTVSDTGTGMTDEVKAHLFEPFYTTKEQGKGTGLGLPTVFGIVKQSGGHITAYSEVGHGTVFKIYLPRVEEATEVALPAEAPVELPRGTETILLVEDEEQVRNLARMVLEECGYTVWVAGNGPDAIRLAEQHEGKIQLLMTDVIMPEMSGRVLTPLLAVLNPGLKVLYMSGYTDTTIIRQDLMVAGSAFLQKPFSMEILARTVREVLDTQPNRGQHARQTRKI